MKQPHHLKQGVYRRWQEGVWRGLCGKLCYSSSGHAKRTAQDVVDSGREQFKPGILSPYHCRECDCWHIGHSRDKLRELQYGKKRA